MNKNFLKLLCFGLIWAIFLIIIGYIIYLSTSFTLKDTLFVESLVIFLIIVLMSISGKPLGISMQALGNINAQYVGNANLEISKRENEILKNKFPLNVKFGFNFLSIIIGCIITFVLSYLI